MQRQIVKAVEAVEAAETVETPTRRKPLRMIGAALAGVTTIWYAGTFCAGVAAGGFNAIQKMNAGIEPLTVAENALIKANCDLAHTSKKYTDYAVIATMLYPVSRGVIENGVASFTHALRNSKKQTFG